MHRGGDLGDLLFEESERVGIGQHDAGHIGAERGLQLLQVDESAFIGRNRRDGVATKGDGRGVGAVRRVGDENALACVTVRTVIGAHQQESGQFTRGAGRRLERRGSHAGHGAEFLFERREQFEPTLGQLRWRAGVH